MGERGEPVQFPDRHSSIGGGSHSLRSVSAGLMRAARSVCVLTVSSAMTRATAPAPRSATPFLLKGTEHSFEVVAKHEVWRIQASDELNGWRIGESGR